jgi:hypothetical protein
VWCNGGPCNSMRVCRARVSLRKGSPRCNRDGTVVDREIAGMWSWLSPRPPLASRSIVAGHSGPVIAYDLIFQPDPWRKKSLRPSGQQLHGPMNYPRKSERHEGRQPTSRRWAEKLADLAVRIAANRFPPRGHPEADLEAAYVARIRPPKKVQYQPLTRMRLTVRSNGSRFILCSVRWLLVAGEGKWGGSSVQTRLRWPEP